MLPIFLVPVVVVMAHHLQHLNSLGAVDHSSLSLAEGVIHKVLQPRSVHGDDIGAFNELHVAHRQRVVVQTAHLAGVQPLHYNAIYVLRHGTGQQIDRIGGGHHRQPGFRLTLLALFAAAAGGQQKGGG